MNIQPFVTVGIPTYNSERYIKPCLESILNQTYTNLEIIISDNGSTDDTEKIVLSYNDNRIKFHKNKENLFCYGNYNRIIELAKGEFLAIYHSDDVYSPYIVEKEVEFLQNHNKIGAVFTEAYLINSFGSIIDKSVTPEKFSEKDVLNFREVYNSFLKFGHFLITSSAMFVKNIFPEVGFFKEEKFFSSSDDERWEKLIKEYNIKNIIFTANDLEMWLRILKKYYIGIIHEKLMFYRVHLSQGTFQHPSLNGYLNFFIVMDYYSNYAKEKNFIFKDAWRDYEIKKAECLFAKGEDFLISGNFKEAKQCFYKFLKSPYFLYLCLSFKNLTRIFWAFLVSNLICFKIGILFQRTEKCRRDRKTKRKLKKMGIL